MSPLVLCLQLSESLTQSLVPFDATSETPLEDQRSEAMVRVQDALLARMGPEALGLLRAARSVKLSIIIIIFLFKSYSGHCKMFKIYSF